MADDSERESGERGGYGPGSGDRLVNIHFTPDLMAGAYANHATIRHTPYELTITFGEIGDAAAAGLAVARVHLSPRFAAELIDALNDNFSKWRYTQGVRDLPESAGHHEAEGDDEPWPEDPATDVPSALALVERAGDLATRRVELEPHTLAGVYANFANVSHSEYEFTITFARLDHEVDEPEIPGVVVQRVNVAPLFLRELIALLERAYATWHAEVEPPEEAGGAP